MRRLIALLITFFIVALSFNASAPSPSTSNKAGSYDNVPQKGYTEGVSWKPVVPIKNAILVNYDGESYIDDFAYLASVPAAVFYSQSEERIFSSPLLFYQKSEELIDEEKVLNAAQGVDYFLEDWLTYSDGTFDNVQFINIPSEDVDAVKGKWSASDYKLIQYDCPIRIARDVALYNWEYSDSAVMAVIQEQYEEIDVSTSNKVNGTISGSTSIRVDVIEGSKEPDPVDPTFHDFNIESDYKYINSYMEWYGPTGFDVINDLTQRGKDPDLQLYCWELGEVAASENWNVLTGASENIGSYIYHSGDWSSAVTYMPTESMGNDEHDTRGGSNTRGPFDEATYEITNTLYPGVDLKLLDETPFFCRQAMFKLTWEDSSTNLGLIVLGPSGAEIAKSVGTENPKEIELMELGEGQYSISVVRLSDTSSDVSFDVEYSWHQTKEKIEGDNLASATQGAVLASITNSPLLYAEKSSLPSYTETALDELGVKKVYLVDLGGHSKGKVAEAIKNSRSLLQPKIEVKEIKKYEDIYKAIQERTQQHDIVFSTINPWTYWHVAIGPKGEEKGGLFLGPAAYSAAHHGCPVFITDVHPELSTANAWHNHFWKNAYMGRLPPSVGCMVLTGKQVYRFLDEMGFDRGGLDYMESMLTVAGQFDIGTSWDRVFVGAAIPGRITGSPVDTSYWTSRSALYQAIIFANPALDERGVAMTTGSSSRAYNGVIRIEPEREVTAQYPLLQSWVSYDHRFNERGSLYWGSDYVTADRITPFRTTSDNPIDKDGKWPDITTSEVVPYYAEKAGYSSVFSTSFDVTMENLNKGAIMWLEVMHGGNRDSGVVGFWNPDQLEPNPWRSYEDGGSTFEPDTAVMSKNTGFDYIRNPLPSQQLHDGVVICLLTQFTQTVSKNGYDFDNAMQNLHSLGFSAGSCLIANTYLHISMVRHGSVFQIIDPWLTSWYCGFAIETFIRDIALGDSVGEAYEKGIKHVGIQYLTGQWWWDIFENVVYYGDPDLRVWSPEYSWEEPDPLPAGTVIDGHSPFGATGHPHAIESTFLLEMLLFSGIFIAIAAGFVLFWRKRKANALNGRGA
jgi:hypothetical protein